MCKCMLLDIGIIDAMDKVKVGRHQLDIWPIKIQQELAKNESSTSVIR